MSKFRVSISIDKDIDKFITALNATPQRFMSQLNRADKDSRKAVVETVKSKIRSYEEPPNADHYMRFKIEHGWEPTPWQRTNILLNSVSYQHYLCDEKLVRTMVGWWPEARYPGVLRQGVYPGRVPKRRKKDLGKPDAFVDKQRGIIKDTNYLADVAYWNETGANDRPKRPAIAEARTDVTPTVISFFKAASLLGAIPKAGDVPF